MKYCSKCGKEIMEEAVICPECGCAVEADAFSKTEADTESSTKINILALLGFIFGLISWILNFFGLVGMAAVVLSCLGLAKLEKGDSKGKIFSIIGLISGICNIIYAVIVIIIGLL